MCNVRGYRQANNDTLSHIIFVGACPGRMEGEDNRPFSPRGRAGASLRTLLSVLHDHYNETFRSACIDDYSLANAHTKVRVRGTPSLKELRDPDNLERLRRIFNSHSDTILIALGKDAEIACREVGKEPSVIYPHPTSRKVNKPRRGSWERNWRYWVETINNPFLGGPNQ
ncbi:uracil-DNA glycosylase family protein [Roseovarius nitratireducens]|uniref:uracil-DNA glycosylase family protein n=1 Tax=Roseovarius nitratireducens TaxID=2044597 RepID=UPI000CE254F6